MTETTSRLSFHPCLLLYTFSGHRTRSRRKLRGLLRFNHRRSAQSPCRSLTPTTICTMYSPIPNPPCKFACPCYVWTKQQRDRLYRPQQGSTYKKPTFEFKLVETIERPKKLLCNSCCEYLFANRAVEPKFESVVLGKRLAPDERDLGELLYRPMTVDIERPHRDSCAGTKKITRKYFSVLKDECDHHGTLPAPKRRMVDTAANETQKKETKQKTTTPRRPSPTRACAKLESKKRHMKLPRICLNLPRKDCCFNAMDFYHTGKSPPIPNKVYTVPSSPAVHMREMPVASSNSGSPATPTTTTSIPLSPVVPGKEVTMVDLPPTGPISTKLNVTQQAMTGVATKSPGTPSPSAPVAGAGYSTSSKACQPQKRTSSQAAQHPAASVASTNSHVFVSRKSKEKKQTPTAGVNILLKQANAAGQTSLSNSAQEQPPIPGLTLLSQASSGPNPKSFPQLSQTKKPSHQAYAEDADEDEEL